MPNKIHKLPVREKRRYELPTAPAQFRYWDRFNAVMTYSIHAPDFVQFFMMFTAAARGENAPVLLQFTGFHDTKNTPAYCGDVVKFGDIVGDAYMMHGEMTVGVVEWLQEKGGFALRSLTNGTITPWCFAVGLTVLGNVFENPELLEV